MMNGGFEPANNFENLATIDTAITIRNGKTITIFPFLMTMIYFIFWFYWSNIAIVLDPTFNRICLVPSERWANNDDVIKMLVIFFFYQF